jgi:hypothetical protein
VFVHAPEEVLRGTIALIRRLLVHLDLLVVTLASHVARAVFACRIAHVAARNAVALAVVVVIVVIAVIV